MDLHGVGTLLLGCVGVFNAVQATLAKRAARRAASHASAATDAVVDVATDLHELTVNTNSKMDALIIAKETAADLTSAVGALTPNQLSPALPVPALK